jgi:hypothetical protein
VIIVKGKDTYRFFYDTVKHDLNFSHKRDTINVPYEKIVVKNVYNTKLPWWVIPLKWSVFFIFILFTVLFLWEKYRSRIKSKIHLNE